MKQKHWQVSVFDKTSEIIRDDTFYTTDTEAYLIFELIDEDFTPDSATVTVYNVYGKATINASVEVADGIVRYEIPVEAIGHPGGWRTQVIFTKDNEDYTTGIINFDVGGHLLDNKKPAIVDIENWNSFITHARELIDDWEQLEEIRQANEQQRELAESARQNEFEANETSRQANELVREEAEGVRQSTFETNEVGRQSDFETAEANRVTFFETAETNRAIAETSRVSAEQGRVTAETGRVNAESSRVSAESGRVSAEQARVDAETVRAEFYEGFDERLDDLESDRVVLKNLIANGDFSKGTTGWASNSGVNIAVVDKVLTVTASVVSGSNATSHKMNAISITDIHYLSFKFMPFRTHVPNIIGINGLTTPKEALANTTNKISLLYAPISVDYTMSFRLNGSSTSGMQVGSVVEFSNFIDINLTAVFGAGNEPTKTEMDELIKITGYFDEITLTQKQLLNWQLKLMRQNRNALIALGGTII